MKVFCYAPCGIHRNECVIRSLHAPYLSGLVTSFSSLDDLLDRLKEPFTYDAVFLLFVSGIDDLRKIEVNKELFRSKPILLRLPNPSEEALNLGHRIGARYITFDDCWAMGIEEILKKLAKTEPCQNSGNESSENPEILHHRNASE